MVWRVGIDSGGTFTDIGLYEDTGKTLKTWKVPSTPGDPSQGVLNALREGLASAGAEASTVRFFGHGTTVATNALIQLRGARTGLITTEGFRDLLEIGRQRRPHLYDPQADKPTVLVPRDLRIGVRERLLHDGTVELPLDEDDVRAAARRLKEAGVEAVAICFLYGFAFEEHELRAKQIVREEIPGVFVCTSHEVAPEFREYERLSTTVVNAYLGPLVQRYVSRLDHQVRRLLPDATSHLTQSNGGVLSFDVAGQLPVRTLLSGPSTGIVAAQVIGASASLSKLITFDMGGTSSDVALITDGKCGLAASSVVKGYPIKAPMFDVDAVGAGGGSIAYIDRGGLLKVGPQSAGAVPGPACYGAGGEAPTVTDANVVLQTLNPTSLLADRLPLRRDLSVAAVQKIATAIGQSVEEAAQGIISVVTANMAQAVRVISVQRGYDPREYTLFAFGGAGPLHAARLARELDISEILIPRTPGALCAVGLLLTDLRRDFSETSITPLQPGRVPAMLASIARVVGAAERWLDEESIVPERRQIQIVADLRYRGQNYELPVPLDRGSLERDGTASLAAAFVATHQRSYGFAADVAIEVVTFRVEAYGIVDKAELPSGALQSEDAGGSRVGEREIWMPESGGWTMTPIYDRALLKPGNKLLGPAVIDQMDSTTLLLPGMVAQVDAHLNLRLRTNQ